MKHLILLLVIVLWTFIAGAQQCCIFKGADKDTISKFDIFFDENGRPISTIHKYIPFGSQVNIIATKINPFKELPTFQTFFQNYDVLPNSLPDISTLLKPINETNPQEFGANVTDKIDTAVSKAVEASLDVKKKAQDLGIEIPKHLTESIKSLKSDSQSDPEIKFSTIESLLKINADLEQQLFEKENENGQNKSKINDLQNKAKELENAIIRIKNIELTTSEIVNEYRGFVSTLDSINHLLTIKPAINKLFDDQFVDSPLTKTLIDKIIRSRLPVFEGSLDTSISIKDAFLNQQFQKMEMLYSSLVNKIKKANDYISSDYFKMTEPTEIQLTNNNKQKLSVNIEQLSVKVNKDIIFKEQLEFITGRINQFRNQKFRDSIFIYTDTVLIGTLRLYHHDFHQVIKSFQANSDEIKVSLPYKNSEPYVIRTKCRFKVDGSSGIFAHFFGGDEKYKVVPAEPLEGSDSLQVIRQRNDKMLISLGFLVNAYVYNPSKLFNTAISLGVNFPINGSEKGSGFTQLVGGVSFISTTINKLSLTIGVSLRKAQMLNINNLTSIDGKEKYTFNNKNVVEPTYDNVTKLGFFFGFSYTLFGANKTTSTE